MTTKTAPKPKGMRKLLCGTRGTTTRTSTPARCSSGACTQPTHPSYHNVQVDPNPIDAYQEALKQLSASHRPSLDYHPLLRPSDPDTPTPTPTSTAPYNPAPQTNTSSDAPPPRKTGHRYHTLPDGRVYVESVDVSAHAQHHGHAPVNKVRPARGIGPFKMGFRSQKTKRGSQDQFKAFRYPDEVAGTTTTAAYDPAVVIPARRRHAVHDLRSHAVAAAAVPVGVRTERQEGCGIKWRNPWHGVSSPRGRARGG